MSDPLLGDREHPCVVQGNEAGELRDLAIIAAGQRVEHYEISAYGTARTLAEHLSMKDAVELLQQTEDEEKAADEKLTEVATSIYGSLEEEEDEDEESEEEQQEEHATAVAKSRNGR
jgi:ferritin-like metal-binding protein YciE